MLHIILIILSVFLVIFISSNIEKSNSSLVKNDSEFHETVSNAQPETTITLAKGVLINIGLFAACSFHLVIPYNGIIALTEYF